MAVIEIGLQVFGRDPVGGVARIRINFECAREAAFSDQVAHGARADSKFAGYFLGREVSFFHSLLGGLSGNVGIL